ncbi:protease HtpX [Bdellovibrio sp. qaytius]|nr:protease HtpX [Bdellovibrio sp. qaytius]
MNFLKRFGMVIIVNVLIMITINIILNVFGVQPYLQTYGINYASLAAFCLIWGFGGAFVSLLLSKFMAKMMMGVKIIPTDAREPEAQWLLQTVYRLARNAQLSKMPEVGIFDSPEMNAFATGPSRSNSLVAVSSGLMNKMNKDEVEGVLAHEIAHVANGDMVTMTLVQGVVNAFGMFLSRVIGHILSTQVEEKSARTVRWVSTLILDIVFSILGMFVVTAFSRYREYRADAGGANLGGKDKMIRALQRLQQETAPIPAEAPMASFQISDRKTKFIDLLRTHPKLEDRIARLQQGV